MSAPGWQDGVQPALLGHGGGGGVPQGNSEARPGLGGPRGAAGRGQLATLRRWSQGRAPAFQATWPLPSARLDSPLSRGARGPCTVTVGLRCSGISSSSTSPPSLSNQNRKAFWDHGRSWRICYKASRGEMPRPAQEPSTQPGLLGAGFRLPGGGGRCFPGSTS